MEQSLQLPIIHCYFYPTGDSKETYVIGPLEGNATENDLNQWPSRELLPSWRGTMESFYWKLLVAGRKVISLIAMALNLDENFFEEIFAFDTPTAYLRLLHYPGDLGSSDEEMYGASAHSDYGMITLLVGNGVRGLQGKAPSTTALGRCPSYRLSMRLRSAFVCYKLNRSRRAFIVNLGDMMERSTLHRVIPGGEERYSVAFFLDPHEDCVVECLQCCSSESSSPRY